MEGNQRASIKMSPEEVATFVEQSRTAAVATSSPHGWSHLVAMWYAVLDGHIWFETKVKSQKVQNLRRDPRMSCLIEAGDTVEELRGVSLQGTAYLSDNTDELFAVCRSVFERYTQPYQPVHRAEVERMMYKRIAVRLDVERMHSWDHRKLGDEPTVPVGSTARFM